MEFSDVGPGKYDKCWTHYNSSRKTARNQKTLSIIKIWSSFHRSEEKAFKEERKRKCCHLLVVVLAFIQLHNGCCHAGAGWTAHARRASERSVGRVQVTAGLARHCALPALRPRLFILHSGTNKSDKHYFIFKVVSWQADLALKCTFFMKKKYNGLLFLKQ